MKGFFIMRLSNVLLSVLCLTVCSNALYASAATTTTSGGTSPQGVAAAPQSNQSSENPNPKSTMEKKLLETIKKIRADISFLRENMKKNKERDDELYDEQDTEDKKISITLRKMHKELRDVLGELCKIKNKLDKLDPGEDGEEENTIEKFKIN
jgi:hypothetical protein